MHIYNSPWPGQPFSGYHFDTPARTNCFKLASEVSTSSPCEIFPSSSSSTQPQETIRTFLYNHTNTNLSTNHEIGNEQRDGAITFPFHPSLLDPFMIYLCFLKSVLISVSRIHVDQVVTSRIFALQDFDLEFAGQLPL